MLENKPDIYDQVLPGINMVTSTAALLLPICNEEKSVQTTFFFLVLFLLVDGV